MENQKINQQFRDDEIALIRHFDKQKNEWITNVYPKIGGRLRLAHEENEMLSIETEIIKYDEQIAVVCAVSATSHTSTVKSICWCSSSIIRTEYSWGVTAAR